MHRLNVGVFLAICMCATPIRADLVNIGSVGTITMSSGTESASFTIPIYDANPATAASLVAWSLGFRVVPIGGATGAVAINPTFSYPVSGNILTSPNPSGAPQSTADSPTAGDYTVVAANTGFAPVVVASSGQNLVMLSVSASAASLGDFALQVVDDGLPSYTYWTDGSFADNPFLFENSPIESTVQIGTIHVVPEPNSAVLIGTLAAFAGWWARSGKQPTQTDRGTSSPGQRA